MEDLNLYKLIHNKTVSNQNSFKRGRKDIWKPLLNVYSTKYKKKVSEDKMSYYISLKFREIHLFGLDETGKDINKDLLPTIYKLCKQIRSENQTNYAFKMLCADIFNKLIRAIIEDCIENQSVFVYDNKVANNIEDSVTIMVKEVPIIRHMHSPKTLSNYNLLKDTHRAKLVLTNAVSKKYFSLNSKYKRKIVVQKIKGIKYHYDG